MRRRKPAGRDRDELQFLGPEQYRQRYGRDAVLPERASESDPEVLVLSWDHDVDAGYLALTEIGAGDAVSQQIVDNPVAGVGDIVLDFDAAGRLLGIEFLDKRALPPGMTPS